MLAPAPDGAQIYYEVYDFTVPWKTAETILLHHGNRSNRHKWYAWIPLLSQHYQVVIFDARGRGGSSVPPPGFEWSLEQFATDSLAIMDALEIDRFHWLGNSFGSVVGEYAAAQYGDRLKTLSLISPPYRFTPMRETKMKWLDEYDRLGGLEFTRRDVRRLFPENADPVMVEWHAEQMASLPDHVWKDLQPFTAEIDLANLLPDIKVPTLIVAAARSDRAPSTEAEFMQQQIPDCELVVFDGQHSIGTFMVEECAAEVLDFLRRRTEERVHVGTGA